MNNGTFKQKVAAQQIFLFSPRKIQQNAFTFFNLKGKSEIHRRYRGKLGHFPANFNSYLPNRPEGAVFV